MAERRFSLFEKMFPDLRTDHGGITLGDVIVTVVTGIATIFTAWRSYDLLMHSLPGNDTTLMVIAIAGLFFLDIGAISWNLAWIFGSTTKYQDWISLGMWVLDILGVYLTVLADTFLYTPTRGALVELVRTLIWWVVPTLGVLNVVAGMTYHLTGPGTIRRREMRRIETELTLRRIQGEAAARREELEVELAKELVAKRQQAIRAYQQLVELYQQLNATERELVARLLGEDKKGLPLGEAFLKAMEGKAEAETEAKKAGETPVGPPAPAEPSRNDRHPHFTTLDAE